MKKGTPLTNEQRSILSAIARERPNATGGQIALIFRARTGREIHVSTAKRARAGGHDGPRSLLRLTPEERSTIEMLLTDSAPEYCYADTAKAFTALTGRPVSRIRVSRIAHEIGLPKQRSGCRPGAANQPEVLSKRVGTERAAKLAAEHSGKRRADRYEPRRGRVLIGGAAEMVERWRGE